MGERTDTNEMQEVIPGMEPYDDRDGYYGPVQGQDYFDPEAFRRKFLAYMTAICVVIVVLAVVALIGVGIYGLFVAVS